MAPGFVTGMLCIDKFCQDAPSAKSFKIVFLFYIFHPPEVPVCSVNFDL